MIASHDTPTVGFVSLGCPKALVDSERILTQLRAEGYATSESYAGADVVIVNTCGFIDSARAESLQAIGEALAENGKVVVTGCLGAEPDVILGAYPNVLAVTGPQQYDSVMQAIHNVAPPRHAPYEHLVPHAGIKLTPKHYAYLKISEGCNNRCSFCIIPSLRGDLVSRPLGEVMKEAEALASSGVKELLVISQDTSAYGVDTKYASSNWRGVEYSTRFYDLCKALGELGIWVRLHYVYPYPHVDAVIPLMQEGLILPYLDMPLQHASPRVLKAMRRPAAAEKTLERIASWRKQCPELVIRSTFIVGFPGETNEDVGELLDWLEEAQIDRAGCFKYENVKGAAAAALDDHIDPEEQQERFEAFMDVQQDVSAERLTRLIGTEQRVLVDAVDAQGATARSRFDAPEIDGVVHLEGATNLRAGQFVDARIIRSDAHDVWGELV